jgi:hypothetical protein
MEIIDTRHVTPDEYSIEKIHIGYDWSGQEPKYIQPYISLSLKPEGYLRNRFGEGGQSYEKKEHGAQKIKIRASEFQQMVEALNDEVKLCHKVLLDHGLIPALFEARYAEADQVGTQSENSFGQTTDG